MGFTVEELASEAGVSLEYLKKQISDHHVLEFAKYCTTFELIGPYLGLEKHELDDIDEDKSHKTALKRKAVLDVWKQKKSFQATYWKFIEALISCDRNDSAYQVCQALAKEEGTSADTNGSTRPTDPVNSKTKPADPKTASRFQDLPLLPLGPEDFSNVLRSVIDIVELWEDLGLALGLSTAKLSEIKSNNSTVRDRMKATLLAWLHKLGSDPSWQTLCGALRDKLVQRKAIAEDIESEVLAKHIS